MGRKKKRRLDMISKITKPVLAATTHIFTVGGVLVAASPLLRGIGMLKDGNAVGAAAAITYDTIGTDSAVGGGISKPDVNKIIGTALVVGLGIGLIAAGAQIRKRIGRTH